MGVQRSRAGQREVRHNNTGTGVKLITDPSVTPQGAELKSEDMYKGAQGSVEDSVLVTRRVTIT